MTFPEEFDTLYEEKRYLAEVYMLGLTDDQARQQFGVTGSIHYYETAIVGIMLVQPNSDIAKKAIKEISPSEFDDYQHRRIWEAAKAGAANVREIVYQLWHGANCPSSYLPEAGSRALLLSESRNWISVADLLSWLPLYRQAVNGRAIKGEIQAQSERLGDGSLTPYEFLNQMALLRERVAVHGH